MYNLTTLSRNEWEEFQASASPQQLATTAFRARDLAAIGVLPALSPNAWKTGGGAPGVGLFIGTTQTAQYAAKQFQYNRAIPAHVNEINAFAKFDPQGLTDEGPPWRSEWYILPENADPSWLIANGITLWTGNVVTPAAGAAARCASVQQDALSDIAILRNQYARAGVPDEHIITLFGDVTLAGAIAGRKVSANDQAERLGCSPLPFPEVIGAKGKGNTEIFPPQDGYINLRAGHLPPWYVYFDPSMPKTSDGPWRPGDYSSYTAPAGSWRDGKPAPPPFRYPNSFKYYFGLRPGYSGIDPQGGGTVNIPSNADDAPAPPPPITAPPVPPDTVPSGPPTVSGPIAPNTPSGVPTSTPPGLNPDGTPVRPAVPIGEVTTQTQAPPLPVQAVFPPWMWGVVLVAGALLLTKGGDS